ncbi:MAG: VPLPA-CTERM sorting domain-containing protein [Gammaproteobacteria bacterium]|nr:VPLPA-CTERM sorting domain-containing protein [Gammaproteobacteria bacterium]
MLIGRKRFPPELNGGSHCVALEDSVGCLQAETNFHGCPPFRPIISPQTLQFNFGQNGITAVSMPAAIWLLGSALGGLGFYRRRA